jgi:hypothetical protein
MTARLLVGFLALAGLAVAGGWAVSTFQAHDAAPARATVPVLTGSESAVVGAPATTTIPNADDLPPDAGGIDGVEQVLLQSPGTPRPMPPGALSEGDELLDERYLPPWNLNGQPVEFFRYLKRNNSEGPGTFLCFAAAIGDRIGGGSCKVLGDSPDPAKPGSRAIGEDEFLNSVSISSGMAYVVQVPPGTTHVVVSITPDGTAPSDSRSDGQASGRRLAIVPFDGIAVVVVPRSTSPVGVEFTAWEGPTLLASARPN